MYVYIRSGRGCDAGPAESTSACVFQYVYIELRPTRVSYSLICSSFLEGNDVVHYHEACFVLIWFAYIYVIGTPIAHTYI